MNTNWQLVADNIWEAILAKVKDLRNSGEKLRTISQIVGTNNQSVICEWLAGNRKAAQAPFATLMSYAENLEIDYMAFFPAGPDRPEPPKETVKPCSEEKLTRLTEENNRLRTQLNIAHGEITALERQIERLAPTPLPEKKAHA